MRGYWIWALFPAALRIAAEILYQRAEVRDDWPTFVGPTIAIASIVSATALFLIGCVGLARWPVARRHARVWIAWMANAAMGLAVLAMPRKYMFSAVLYK